MNCKPGAEKRFTALIDLLVLTDDEFERFIPDLFAWRAFCKGFAEDGIEVGALRWTDDGKPGISGVVVVEKETGETTLIDFGETS
jgi:hypothetical protein